MHHAFDPFTNPNFRCLCPRAPARSPLHLGHAELAVAHQRSAPSTRTKATSPCGQSVRYTDRDTMGWIPRLVCEIRYASLSKVVAASLTHKLRGGSLLSNAGPVHVGPRRPESGIRLAR